MCCKKCGRYIQQQEATESFASPDKIGMNKSLIPFLFMALIFYGKSYLEQLCYYFAAKSPFSFPLILLPRGKDSKRNPIMLKHMDSLFLPRYYL